MHARGHENNVSASTLSEQTVFTEPAVLQSVYLCLCSGCELTGSSYQLRYCPLFHARSSYNTSKISYAEFEIIDDYCWLLLVACLRPVLRLCNY